MTKEFLINQAETYLDDMSELSSVEFETLFDKMYRKISTMRPWEGTKTEFTGTTSGSVPYVALPSDFLYLTANANHTDSSYQAERPVIFVGSTYRPVEVVSFSDRRQYRDNNNYAYIDSANQQLVFTKQPAVETIEFDYHRAMPDLLLTEPPWFPEAYQPAIYHLMVSDNYIIMQSDKAKSYQRENEQKANDFLEEMAWWNSQLIQM